MVKLTLASLFFLFASISVLGQAVPKHISVVGGCMESAKEAIAIFQKAESAPPFNLYVICDAKQWHELAMKNDFKETSHSFTVLHKGMIWLGPKALANLHEAIEHELKHLRCDCDLGENH